MLTRKTFRQLLPLVALLTISFSLHAQNIVVSGTVTDPKGAALSGATVVLKGTSSGTQTNAQGSYSISAPSNGVLVFSSVGFGEIEEQVSGRTTINVTLTVENAAMNEVVVIGYGTA